MAELLELVGAVSASVIYISSIFVFVFRLKSRLDLAKLAGGVCLLNAVPLLLLLAAAPQQGREVLYYIQIGFMLLWMVVTLVVDYVYRVEFRNNIRLVIAYVVLFFAGTGGMLGVSALAGQTWITINGVLFLIMAVLAFVQRAKTGY